MSYLNRMLIEEDSQFECDGVYDSQDSQIGQKRTLNMISEQQPDSSAFHIIVAAEPLSFKTFFMTWWINLGLNESDFNGFNVVRNLNVMITLLESERLKCVQNEEAKKFYREGGQIKNESIKKFPYSGIDNLTLESHKSIGDDAEDFFRRLVEDQIFPNDLDINRPFLGEMDDFFFGIWATKTCWNKKQYVHTFHVSMLSEEEEKYLNANEASLDALFKFKTILHKTEMNFSLTVCLRKTFLLRGEILYGITETDPWQMRIMKNFQDDPPPKKFSINPYEYQSR